jgi:PD-(D/E)XK endonuclease
MAVKRALDDLIELAGGLLKGCKERGEWAELYFMMLVVGLGMKVLRLFGESGRYDVGVENGARVVRVQVKSTIYKRRGEGYSLNVMGPQRKKYAPGSVDFFAILLIPIDEWYIIPYEVMGRTNLSIHFTPESVRQKYGAYREAWDLLKETGLTIQACLDPDWPEANEELEARVGIEPTHKGFADLSLTTWVPRP